ncbi:MAG: DUF3618 domain-containing protein [Actinobacteria bacterium]|nr:DUF3618 domain-containing protein [Actinomycetota bacterium]
MGQDPRETVRDIEQTREEMAVKVDQLIDGAKVEAVEVGKKLAIGAAAVAGLLLVGMLAKRRVRG